MYVHTYIKQNYEEVCYELNSAEAITLWFGPNLTSIRLTF